MDKDAGEKFPGNGGEAYEDGDRTIELRLRLSRNELFRMFHARFANPPARNPLLLFLPRCLPRSPLPP